MSGSGRTASDLVGGPHTRDRGLTSADVARRRAAGQGNVVGHRTSRSAGEIVRANVLTRFNAILGIALVAGAFLVLACLASVFIYKALQPGVRPLDAVPPTAR